ncbi:MAG TPA: type III secretion system inner rod subunit SctI [Herbaspirillum sp.]|jgi:type III secretion system YscI/HrpB-like protein|nr:type III secretion system inner rod subunit SctI [Herbaspirillum sp.]
MNAVAALSIPIDAVTASSQIPHESISQHDVQQFQQAMFSKAPTETAPGNIIKDGIAAIEKREVQFRNTMSRLSDVGKIGTSTSDMLAFQAEHLKMHITYEATARVISLTAQNITELMRMQ